MVLNFLLSAALSFGASSLLSLFASKKPPRTVVDNKLDSFIGPQSAFGTTIPSIYGKVRVQGVYLAAQVPFDWERDDYLNGATNQLTMTYIYYGNLGVLWSKELTVKDGEEIKNIWFSKKNYYQQGEVHSYLGFYWGRWEGLTVNNYYGAQTSADPYLGFMGENNIAHKGKCYTVMHRLRLNNGPNSGDNLFDNRYPDLEAEIDTHTNGPLYLSEIIEDILLQAGYSSQEIDVTEVNTIEVRGFKTGVGSVAEKLAELQKAYFFEVVDTGFELKFITQYRPTSSAYIPLEFLAAHEDGGTRPELFTEEIGNITDLPTQVRVNFNDYNKNYQRNSKTSFEIKIGTNQNIETVELDLTLTETEALNIANRLLMLAWLRVRTYKFAVLPRYAFLEAGDVIEIPFHGETKKVQINRINMGANGLVQIEAYPYDAALYDLSYTAPAPFTASSSATQGTPISTGQTNIYAVNSVTNSAGTVTYVLGTDYTQNLATGTITPIIGGGISNSSTVVINYQGTEQPAATPDISVQPTTLNILDIVKPTDTSPTGLYAFANGSSAWVSATLYQSLDGTNYSSLGPIYRSIFGDCLSTLPNGSGVDNISTLNIRIPVKDVLTTGTALVGNEILEFSTATLTSSDTTFNYYTLSDFNRALRKTSGSGHVSNEDFYLLSGYKSTIAITESQIGDTLYFKAVSPGQTLTDVTAVSLVLVGKTFTALSPIITGFSPTQGAIADAISIFGSGFTGATSGAINGVNLSSFTVVSDSLITGIISSGTTTGKVTVTASSSGQSVTDFFVTTGSGSVVWGDIGGNLIDQPDLQTALSLKVDNKQLAGIRNQVKNLIDNPPSTGSTWGDITGNLSDNTILWEALKQKVDKKRLAQINQNYQTLINQLSQKQDILVSGTNIKTINGESLLGSSDLSISGSLTTTQQNILTLITMRGY